MGLVVSGNNNGYERCFAHARHCDSSWVGIHIVGSLAGLPGQGVVGLSTRRARRSLACICIHRLSMRWRDKTSSSLLNLPQVSRQLRDRAIRDGRSMIILALILYFAILLLLRTQAGNLDVWQRLGVYHLRPSFADMRFLLPTEKALITAFYSARQR